MLLVTCYHVQRRQYLIFYQIICNGVLLCNITKSSKEAVAEPTWVQSKIADFFVIEIMVYMGTVTNSNST